MTVQGHFHLQHSLPGEILLAQVSAPTPTPSTLGWWQYWCGMSASLSSPVMATVLTADIHAPPCGDESFQMCGSCFHFRKTLWLQACECTQWLWVVYMQWFPFQHTELHLDEPSEGWKAVYIKPEPKWNRHHIPERQKNLKVESAALFVNNIQIGPLLLNATRSIIACTYTACTYTTSSVGILHLLKWKNR